MVQASPEQMNCLCYANQDKHTLFFNLKIYLRTPNRPVMAVYWSDTISTQDFILKSCVWVVMSGEKHSKVLKNSCLPVPSLRVEGSSCDGDVSLFPFSNSKMPSDLPVAAYKEYSARQRYRSGAKRVKAEHA